MALTENENVSKLQHRCRAGNLKRTNIKRHKLKKNKIIMLRKQTCFDNYKSNQNASIYCAESVFSMFSDRPALAKAAGGDWLDVVWTCLVLMRYNLNNILIIKTRIGTV